MMQKRSTLSLLLISFILVFALSLSAQEVTFEDGKVVERCATQLLDITVDNLSDLGAVEVVFEVTGTGGSFYDAINVNWDAGFTVLTNHIVDLSGVDNVSPDTIRIAAMLIDPSDACLPVGQTVIAQVEFTTNDNCAGTLEFAGATVSCPSFDISTQFANCDGTAVIAAVVNAGTVTVQNQDPTMAAIADETIGWGTTFVGNAVGSDFDDPNGCEVLTYSVVSGPAALTVNATTGAINWATTGADIGSHAVEIQVEDACGATASQSFNICVSNEAPVITCPADSLIALGSVYSSFVTATDADAGPSALLYTLIDNAGFGDATLNAATGEFTWPTLFDETYKGAHTFVVAVTDGGNIDDPCAPRSADTCEFTVTVVNYLITIEKTHQTIQGQGQTVEVNMVNSGFENYPMGGFDFLFAYDASALTFQTATPGQFVLDCDWEYFTYRYGANGNCGTGCPTGEIRVNAIAEMNDGGHHPACFTNAGSVSNQLVVLNFLVTNDRTFECMYAPVQFYWYDCGDNTVSDVDGNQLFMNNHIYNFEDTNSINYSIDLADPTVPFPSYSGAHESCDISLNDGKPDPLRFIDFVNGGIDIACADSIDARGDLNLNEIVNEIADAVLYSNYFIYGTSVFTVNLDGQIAASDVNADGITLSVADLVYLIRILVGDALPYEKEVVNDAAFVNAQYQHNDAGVITVTSDMKVAAAHVVVEGEVNPTLLAPEMTMLSNFDGTNTRILVYSLENKNFTGDMIHVGDNEIVSLDMADDMGNQVLAKWIPHNYSVEQNYPNPFNPTTKIEFNLPASSDVTLTIYNVNGQTVKEFKGAFEAGDEGYFEWDASSAASGVYFYRLSAGEFSAVKKMVLLK